MKSHSALQDLVNRRLDALQFGPEERTIMFVPVACGLGGQISGRVHTLALALALGRKAVFPSLADPPYGQSFAPLHCAVARSGDPGEVPLAEIATAQPDQAVRYDPQHMSIESPGFGANLLTRVAEQLGAEIPERLLLEGLIFNWMKPAPAMAAHCQAVRRRLGIDDATLGVHFRRGDKTVETAFVPAAEINRQIATIHQRWAFTSLFLASDSAHAPSEIECPAGVRLIFDADEKRYNNANHKMLMASPELAEEETRVAFRNIALLAACGGTVGQDNAHFATLAAGAILAREDRAERIVLIDGRFAQNRSPLLALWFRGKLAARALARRLFPHLTMRARTARAASRQLPPA